MPKVFEDFVPVGVVQGWKTGHWIDKNLQSFQCFPDKSSISLHNGIQEYNQANYEKAFSDFTEAAKYDNPEAEFFLGRMYDLGEGVPKDDIKAIEWFKKSAAQEHAWSQYCLGKLYLESNRPNQEAGFRWLHKAFEKGISDARLLLLDHEAELLFQIGLEHLNKNQNYCEAIEWLQKASYAGNLDAKFVLYNLYFRGEGVPQDIEKAIVFLKEAANGNLAQAQFMLGLMYTWGIGVEKNPKEADNLKKQKKMVWRRYLRR